MPIYVAVVKEDVVKAAFATAATASIAVFTAKTVGTPTSENDEGYISLSTMLVPGMLDIAFFTAKTVTGFESENDEA